MAVGSAPDGTGVTDTTLPPRTKTTPFAVDTAISSPSSLTSIPLGAPGSSIFWTPSPDGMLQIRRVSSIATVTSLPVFLHVFIALTSFVWPTGSPPRHATPASQRFTTPSYEALYTSPSQAARAVMVFECPRRTALGVDGLSRSRRLRSPQRERETMCGPTHWQPTCMSAGPGSPEMGLKVASSAGASPAISQTLTDLSAEDVSTLVPSGLHAQA
mmetsp:Transcript_254/g.782  ORF Transcript_254/g.782 Transcript_254/m.782 type:complete len:215 (+) Transcript_254:318-962(+)